MNVRGWIWSPDQIKDTPSKRQGMSSLAEAKLRREGCKIMLEVGAALRLKANPTLATAGVYFHRFYMFHSFQHFPRELTALGCLFLAGKVEETPKKCRDICNFAAQKFPSLYVGKYRSFIDEVMGIERVLLQTMKFDLQVEHPYKYLLQYVKKFKLSRDESSALVQTAWTFVNDSISTTLCLLWEPQVIAVSLIYLAVTVQKVTLEDATNWWDEYVSNLSTSLIDDICHKVLDFYSISKDETMDFMPPKEIQDSAY